MLIKEAVERVKKPSLLAGLPDGSKDASSRERGVIVAAGEASQTELLHARLAPMVNRLLWTFLGCDSERDDLAHDIFIKIFRGVHKVRDPARLESWAMRVVMNSVKNEFRRRKLRRLLSLDSVADADHPRVHPDFEGRELLARTQRVLEALPVEERLAVTLRLMEQASAERIAELCGFSVRTAKRRLATGRERFLRLAQGDPLLSARFVEDAESEESSHE
jgi:RNA polymerase sigma-70 factor (ECF subfamily)